MKPFALLFILLLLHANIKAQPTGSGYALDMTNTSRYVQVPHSAGLAPTTAISLEAWIKAASWGINSWSNSIISKDDWSTASNGYVLRCGASGMLSFTFGTAAGWKEIISPAQMQLNKWHHVAATYDGTTYKIYIDGVMITSAIYASTITISTYPLRIGEFAYSPGGTRTFDGIIEEVRVWNIALPESTIRSYMCSRVGPQHPNYSNLKGYWRFDEGIGTTTADLSGNNNHGSLVNSPLWVVSGAPLGDLSAFSYSSPFSMSLKYPGLDSMSVSNFSGIPQGVHIYRVNGKPNATTVPASFNSLDTTRFWGVRVIASTTLAYSLYINPGSAGIPGGCNAGLVGRTDNAATVWTSLNAPINPVLHDFTLQASGSQEIAIASMRLGNLTASGPTTFCSGDSLLLKADTSSSYSYQWIFNGNTVNGATFPGYYAKAAGSYQVAVSNGSCSDTSDAIVINLIQGPLAILVANGPSSVCQGDSVTLSTTTSPLYSYVWKLNGAALSGASGAVYYAKTSGNYSVVISDGTCSSTSNTISVAIKSIPPTPVISLFNWGLQSSTVNGNQWYGPSGSIPGATASYYSPLVNGNYYVIVTGTNGCKSLPSNTLYFGTVGIPEESQVMAVELIPNPSNGIFAGRNVSPNTVKYSIVSLKGELLQQGEIKPGESKTLSLGGIPGGVYLFRTETSNGHTIQRLVIQ